MHLKNYNNQVQKLLDFGESNVQFFGKPTVMHLIKFDPYDPTSL